MSPDRMRRGPTFMASSSRPVYLAATMLRFVSSLLVALALLFSPLAMSGGAAVAASHGPAAMAVEGDCPGTHAPADKTQSHAKIGCAVSCAAFPAVGSITNEPVAPTKAKAVAARHQLLVGIHPEGETPPPRITPEI